MEAPDEGHRLPVPTYLFILAGAITGVCLRLVFSGQPGGAYAAMMASFIFLAPILVSAITVYLAERQERRTWGYYIWAGTAANIAFVLGTLIILVEGLICAIVIVPLVVVMGIAGALIMGAICRWTRWSRAAMHSFIVLPLVLGGIESNVETPSRHGSVERTLLIQARPETIWSEIMTAADIRPDEMEQAWIFRIGVPPPPMAGVVRQTSEGPVRQIRMGKDVHYDQVFVERRENEYVRWRYRVYPDSFPPYALDDHVVVAGYYFDVIDTSYTLTPVGSATALTVSMSYRVTTQFNWYTEPLAQLMLGNFEEVLLGFYRGRSET